jgi:HEPN domain-containing protein
MDAVAAHGPLWYSPIGACLDVEDRKGWESRRFMPEETQLRRLCQAESACNPRAFWRAASQRLVAANLLIESRIYLEAVYLAGYVVECALKSLILERTPAARRKATCQELTSGARSHNFDFLSESLRAKGCPAPPNIRASLLSLRDEWRTDLRYVGALIPRREAEDFLQRVKDVYEWVQRSL